MRLTTLRCPGRRSRYRDSEVWRVKCLAAAFPRHTPAGGTESTSRAAPSPPLGTQGPRTAACPLQLWCQRTPRVRGGSEQRPPRLDAARPCPAVSLLSHLSTPPRNTASLPGPMLAHVRNKTQKQIKRQLLFKQERGPAAGAPGRRPLVPTPGDRSPVGSGGIKAGAPCGLHQPWVLHLISFVFPPPVFALTQVAFIETLAIKCKTRPGTADGAAGQAYTPACRALAVRVLAAGQAATPRLWPLRTFPPFCSPCGPGLPGPWTLGLGTQREQLAGARTDR